MTIRKSRPKFLNDPDPWMLAEDIPDSDIFFFQIPMSCFASDTSYPFLKNYTKVLTHYKKFHMDFYFGQKDSDEVGESIVENLYKRPTLGPDINANVVKWSHRLIEFALGLYKLPLKEYSNRQLWELYVEQDRIHTKLYTYGWLPVACDMFHNNFSKRLKSYLYSICSDKAQAEVAFIALTTPSKKTIVAQEREEFLEIYDEFAKAVNKPTPTLRKELQKHAASWGHMGYIYAGNVEPFSAEHYLNEMQELRKSNFTAKKLLAKEAWQLKDAAARRKTIYRRLKIDKTHRSLFETATDFAVTKLVRRHAQLLILLAMHRTVLTEISKRLKLSRYEVQFMLYDEIKDALLNGRLDRAVLKARLKECVLYTEKDFEDVYIGAELKKLTQPLKRLVDTKVDELSGQPAQPGYARGKVKIIIRAKDMHKMKQGDILVSIATDPDIVPAMKKAAAIVTEQGGITSHAAIVSRELGIPCVIGTKIATKVFKDGDMVEVDASHGWVKKISP